MYVSKRRVFALPPPPPSPLDAVPKLQAELFRILGIRFSDKSFVYVLAAALAFSEGRRSVAPSVAGLLFGVLYAVTPLSRLRFPLPVRIACRRYLLPLIEAPPAPLTPAVGAAEGGGGGTDTAPAVANNGTAQVQGPGGGGGEMANQEAALAGSITELVAMGFDATAAREALLETGGNVEAAVGRLCR